MTNVERKISATARLPKRSTIIESPAGKIAQPSDVGQHRQRVQDHHSQQQQQHHFVNGGHNIPQASSAYHSQPHPPPPQESLLPYHQPPPQAPAQSTQSAQSPPSQFTKPNLGKLPLDPHSGQVLRPAFARNNTEVMILEDSTPNSPTVGDDNQITTDDSKTFSLGDIHSIVEAAQAREQRRSLPRDMSIPYIAGLNPLELATVKHFAMLALMKSPPPLRDLCDLDELLEMVEFKKSNFWQKLFKNEKKNAKKKGP